MPEERLIKSLSKDSPKTITLMVLMAAVVGVRRRAGSCVDHRVFQPVLCTQRAGLDVNRPPRYAVASRHRRDHCRPMVYFSPVRPAGTVSEVMEAVAQAGVIRKRVVVVKTLASAVTIGLVAPPVRKG